MIGLSLRLWIRSHHGFGVGAAVIVTAMLAGACSTSVTIEPVQPAPSSAPDDASGDAPALFAGRYSWTDGSCSFAEPAEVATTCGWLDVPERWDDPDDGDMVRLHVARFSAGPTDTAPLVYLEGGPGGDALANLDQSFDTLFGALVDQHEMIVIGQRGTGSAEPHLQCDETLELSRDLLATPGDLDTEIELYQAAYSECAAGFREAGVDTSAYNSVQSAHDVEALRLALGFERWNVLGISYGTRLAQTLIRLFPEGLRSVILDSAVPMDRDPSVDVPLTASRAFEVLWAGCASSAVCGPAFPELENRFFALVDELDSSPVSIEVSDLLTGEQLTAVINGDDLMGQAFQALYSKSAFAGIPELVAQLELGETAGLEALVSQSVTSEPFLAAGMFWSVECHEEFPFVTEQSVNDGATGDPRYDSLSESDPLGALDGICGACDAGSAPSEENQPVVSDLPVLVLAGEYDPITPPADGEGLLAGFARGYFVELPHTGHAAIVDPCASQVALTFLATPDAAPDTSCVAEVPEPDWVPDLFASIEFEQFDYDAGFVSASGLVPVGWDAAGDGVVAWQDNALHVAVILQQVAPSFPADLLLDSMSDAFGVELEEAERLAVEGREWTRYEAPIPGSVIDLFIGEDDDDTFLVLFQHSPAARDAALATLTGPILGSIGP